MCNNENGENELNFYFCFTIRTFTDFFIINRNSHVYITYTTNDSISDLVINK